MMNLKMTVMLLINQNTRKKYPTSVPSQRAESQVEKSMIKLRVMVPRIHFPQNLITKVVSSPPESAIASPGSELSPLGHGFHVFI
jgi:hypothetical protein